MATTLYPGIPFSPQATLTNNIGAADTIIEVSDISTFPLAPNLATIGTDEEGETILYTAKTGTALSGCQRGVEGTARAWTAGELIGRNFTAKDHADLIAAVSETREAATTAQTAATTAGSAAKAAQDAAQAAREAAEAAEGKATAAAETATTAAHNAARAREDAQTAADAAATARGAAETARTAASSASSAATTAQETAKAAKEIADKALETAKAAGGLYPQIIVTVEAGAIVTCSNGSESYEKISEDAAVVFDVPDYGIWNVWANVNGKDTSIAAISVDTCKQYTINLEYANIYGATWDGSSTTRLTRTDDAALFTDPSPAVGTGAGSSPFDNCLPWSGMTKVTDGENVLVKIPKYWVKVSHTPFKVQIADKATPGYQVSPAHRDRGDGKGERDVVYIGRYECGASYMSRSGQGPKGNERLSGFRSGIHKLGAEYWQADFALQLTWWFLYIVEFADWNGQTAIGRGNVDSDAKINTGATDSMSYHTGRAAGTDGQTAVQYRNIENLWGNVREWRDGIIFSNSNICTYNNPADFSDAYNGTGAVVRSNKRAEASGWIKAWGHDTNDPSFIYPSEVGGSETTFVPDYCHYSARVWGLSVGGSCGEKSKAGTFQLDGYRAPGVGEEKLGSRLQKLP